MPGSSRDLARGLRGLSREVTAAATNYFGGSSVDAIEPCSHTVPLSEHERHWWGVSVTYLDYVVDTLQLWQENPSRPSRVCELPRMAAGRGCLLPRKEGCSGRTGGHPILHLRATTPIWRLARRNGPRNLNLAQSAEPSVPVGRGSSRPHECEGTSATPDRGTRPRSRCSTYVPREPLTDP